MKVIEIPQGQLFTWKDKLFVRSDTPGDMNNRFPGSPILFVDKIPCSQIGTIVEGKCTFSPLPVDIIQIPNRADCKLLLKD